MYDLERKLGEDAELPVKILANINSQSFGDFISSLFYVNSVADRFEHRFLSLLYRDDMDFKTPVLSLAAVNLQVKVPSAERLPGLDLINSATPMLAHAGQKSWYQAALNEQHLFITDTMSAAYNLCALDRLRYLAFPDKLAKVYEAKLEELGVPTDRWFCTMHCREPGYQGKPNIANFRDSDPRIFWEACQFVIQQLGGVVVRLGHPGMTPYPATPGLIDISANTDPLLQCFAISRSRFLFAGPSGPTAVAEALGVPMGVLDAVDLWTNGPMTLVRTIDVISPTGEVINQVKYNERRLSKVRSFELAQKHGYAVVKNSAQTLLALVKRIYDMTSDQKGWRPSQLPSSVPRPNSFTWPGVLKPKFIFL